MTLVRANDVLVSFNSTQLACATDADINITVDMIPSRQPNDTMWSRSIPRGASWTANVSGLLFFATRNLIYTELAAFTSVTIRFHTAQANDGYFEGTAWVQSWGESSSSTGFATYNASFLGDGELTFVPYTEPVDGIGNMIIGSTFIVT